MTQVKIFSITEITRAIKALLEDNLPTLWVQGEISNFKAHSSGHYYFTLKDENAQISAVMWRSRTYSLKFQPQDGLLVQALGSVRVYEKAGRYQMDVVRLQPAGLGALQMAFERLKEKLNAQGLFAEEHKKSLPPYPQTIGVITSASGAAIRDINKVLKRRAPQVQLILRPALVQGKGAAEDIAEAIREFNAYGKIDLLIVGRGGGSLEDLWAFNEETLARAIYESHIPVISAVGHEIDFTIADFTADLRAPTPSAAAELAAPDYVELRKRILTLFQYAVKKIIQLIQQRREKIITLGKSYGLRRPEDILRQYALTLDELHNKMHKAFKQSLTADRELIKQLNLRLRNLSPKHVLERGYSITYFEEGIVSDIHKINAGTDLISEVKNGKIYSTVKQTRKGEESG